jgi:hypothetical protein
MSVVLVTSSIVRLAVLGHKRTALPRTDGATVDELRCAII